MLLPCEYCRMPVEADHFMRLGVWPCCRRCSWIPTVAGCIGLVLFLALGVYMLVTL